MTDNSISVDTVLRMNAREAVPDSAKIPSISSSSLVQGRNTVKFTPSNGKSFKPNQQAIIRLNAAQEYLAPTSTALVMDIKVNVPAGAADAGRCCFDDLHLSILDRFRLTIGGVLVDEVFECGKTTTALNSMTVSPEHYDGAQNVLMKSWKHCIHDTNVRGDAALPVVAAAVARKSRYTTNGVWQRGRDALLSDETNVRIVIPMSYLSSVCRSHKFFPLRNVGNMEFAFQFASPQTALVNPFAALGDAQDIPVGMTYEVSDIYMTADLVNLNSEYVGMMDRLLQGEGMTLPLDKYTVLTAQNAISTQSSKKQFTYSFGAPVVKSCVFWKQLESQQNSFNNFSSSGFVNNNQKSFRLRVGSKYLPQYDSIQSNEELYWTTQKALGMAGNIGEQVGLGNYKSFSSNSPATGTCIFMFSFEKNSESADVVLDGIDARSTSLFVAEIEDSLPAGTAPDTEILYCAFNTIAVLKLANGALELEE